MLPVKGVNVVARNETEMGGGVRLNFNSLYIPAHYLSLHLKSHKARRRQRFPVLINTYFLFIRILYFVLVSLCVLFITFSLFSCLHVVC